MNGARFTLYGDSDCKSEIGSVESARVDNVDGKVIFRSLREGTYYLKETQAPDGYVRSTETWTVEVKKKSDTEVSVTLKDSSGKSSHHRTPLPFLQAPSQVLPMLFPEVQEDPER